jgi:hypothetical protein
MACNAHETETGRLFADDPRGFCMSDVRYFNLSIPAPKRLALMREAFKTHGARYPHCPDRAKPRHVFDVRNWGFHNWESAFCNLSQGRQADNSPVWYCHTGPCFRGESDAQNGTGGYYTDTHCDETAIGIVARLPHGRFLAGYRWTSNDERVYFPEVFTDEDEAARMADEHARVFAESAREDSERFDAMQDAEIEVSDAEEELRDALALRRAGRRTTDDVSRLIGKIRALRETLGDATAAYERG